MLKRHLVLLLWIGMIILLDSTGKNFLQHNLNIAFLYLWQSYIVAQINVMNCVCKFQRQKVSNQASHLINHINRTHLKPAIQDKNMATLNKQVNPTTHDNLAMVNQVTVNQVMVNQVMVNQVMVNQVTVNLALVMATHLTLVAMVATVATVAMVAMVAMVVIKVTKVTKVTRDTKASKEDLVEEACQSSFQFS